MTPTSGRSVHRPTGRSRGARARLHRPGPARVGTVLRSVGVPARVVTGFAGGTPRGDVRMMTGADAHAWVQVHLCGLATVLMVRRARRSAAAQAAAAPLDVKVRAAAAQLEGVLS